DTVDVMVNGRIARSMPSAELAADRDLQQRLLGVKVGPDAESDDDEDDLEPGVAEAPDTVTVYTIRRSTDDVAPAATPEAEAPRERAVRGFTRWNAVDPRSAPRDRLVEQRADAGGAVAPRAGGAAGGAGGG